MKKILVVEDDQNISRSLAVRLKNAGYDVTVASDALSGLEFAIRKPPDLVLLDISLPAGNGFSVAEQLQSLLSTATPFVFLTASQKPGLREKANKLGAAAFFQKPYDGSELLEAIRLVLAGERVSEESQVYSI